jgi:hypothetical protein
VAREAPDLSAVERDDPRTGRGSLLTLAGKWLSHIVAKMPQCKLISVVALLQRTAISEQTPND